MHSRIIVIAAFLFAVQPLSAAVLPSANTSTATPAATNPKANDAPTQLFKKVKSVKVCFTVKANGSVSDPHVRAIYYRTGKMSTPGPKTRREFERKFMKPGFKTIIQKWKFYPRRINGKPVATPNVCQTIEFEP